MKILVLFVEVTDYNIARIENVYNQCTNIEFTYVYCSNSVSGHKHKKELPQRAYVLEGNSIQKVFKLREIVTRETYDCMIINGYSELSRLWCIMYCKRKGIPYAIETDTQLQIPNMIFKRMAKSVLLKSIFRGNAYGFAGGTRQKELFYHYGMKEKRVKVLPMTVDVSHLKKVMNEVDKDCLKKRYKVENKKVILYVGRFEEVKNLPLLIQATFKLAKRYEDFVVYMVGSGSQESKLRSLIEECELEEKVNIVGYKVMPELAEYYVLADVFVLPSTSESWGLVVNEALTCGVPVLASEKVGAVDDLIVRGMNGDVFNEYNSDELERLLEEWLYLREKRIKIDVMKTWNFETYGTLFREALKEIIAHEN